MPHRPPAPDLDAGIGGACCACGDDRTVPAATTRSARKLYHKSPAITDLREFNDRGHSLTIDHGWREIADEVLDWLSQRVK